MPLILGLETSGLAGSVALSQGERVLGQRSLEQAGRRHAQTLISECAELLKEHGVSPADLSAVAATQGPGSFTGLRVGVVAAKTLAYALRIPLVLLDTFDLVAAQLPSKWSEVWIVDDAQRQELFVGRYVRGENTNWTLTGERFLTPFRDWLSSLPADSVVVGPGTARIPPDLASLRVMRDAAFTIPRAETVCRLAAGRLAAGSTNDPWTAAPFYVRLSAAEEKAAKSGEQ
jgi:tRNA threonylcarbamoyladenosine biosynthesis protein TsaB